MCDGLWDALSLSALSPLCTCDMVRCRVSVGRLFICQFPPCTLPAAALAAAGSRLLPRDQF